MASKREEFGQIVIRPPEGMRERIKAAADANKRSMNAEIVDTLEKAYPPPPSRDSLMRAFDLLTGVASKMRARIRAGEVEGSELAEMKEELAEADAALKILGDRIIAGKD